MQVAAWHIRVALFNFAVGVTLGLCMSWNPAWWQALSEIHGEVNPFGFLTILIFGMTFAVLYLTAGIEVNRIWGYIQLVIAEVGVCAISFGVIWQNVLLWRGGWILQCMTPVLLLINIVRAARKAHTINISERLTRVSERLSGKVPAFLFDDASIRSSDAIGKLARRGTDLALLVLVAMEWISLVRALWLRHAPSGWMGFNPTLFEYG